MAGQNISHEGHRQRMRARVEQYGLESLAPHEALEYLLYITNARRDTNGMICTPNTGHPVLGVFL